MKTPPRWADKFLEWYCKEELVEDLQGDLYERFNERIRRRGIVLARLLFIVDVISFFRPYTVRRSRKQNLTIMLKPFYRTAVRTLLKRKLYSAINIAGLALGMTAFLLISIYVLHERSYDNFHVKGDRIFRLKLNMFSEGILETEAAGVGAAVGPDLKSIFPEIQKYVRLRRNQVMLSYKETVFRETTVFFGSEDFFTVFSIPLIKGTDATALREPWKVAVSESFAKKYFGNEDPMGKVLTNLGHDQYEVTAVFKDIPENSHLKIDAVLSFSSLELIFGKDKDPYLTNWGWGGYPTYIELDPSANPHEFESKLNTAVAKKTENTMNFELQPIRSIHLNSHFNNEIAPNGDKDTVDILALVAGLILVMAWINYVSLATARSLERAKEVGIRKVLGSSRLQLIGQFLLESLLYNATALVITIILVKLLLPHFAALVGRDLLSMELFNTENISFLFILFVSGIFCSGLYPAFVISSHVPVRVLKGSFKSSAAGSILRKGLVITQFAAAVVLITGSLVTYRQIQHMRNSPVGVNLDQVLVVEGPIVTDSLYDMRFRVLKQQIMSYPGVKSVAASSAVPGRPPRSANGSVRLQRQASTAGRAFDVFYVDHDFATTFGLEIVAGRDFAREFSDEKSVMVNESGMHALGITDPRKVVGEKILVYGEPVTVVGVLKDYFYRSLRERIQPAVYWCETRVTDFYSFRVQQPESMSALVDLAETGFKEQFPGNQFIYFFLDDLYNEQYRSEQQFAKAFGLFSIVGICIACLGLYGLSSYLILLRWKEIAIRKVLGASINQVAVLISREFVMIVLAANVIAWPLAWWLMNSWLSRYASRIDLSLIFLLIPTVLVMIIAILTVASQAIRAAREDPAVVIREN